jgi:tRNA-specific 2-thiouridylase
VKFDKMLRRAQELGYDYIATGHYAVNEYDEERGRWLLKRPKDRSKDQTYVLYALTQEQLSHTLFPLGELEKSQVRELAEQAGLVNSNKPDSQDICFVPDGDYASFIERRTGSAFKPGNIVDRDGNVLGSHAGLIHYTIGQRKGIGIAAAEPLYVYEKNVARNELVVDTDAKTLSQGVIVDDVNFIARKSLYLPERFAVKTHYRQHERPATVEQIGETRIRITFDDPQRACAPGQAAVVYDEDTVVCGGTIVSSF